MELHLLFRILQKSKFIQNIYSENTGRKCYIFLLRDNNFILTLFLYFVFNFTAQKVIKYFQLMFVKLTLVFNYLNKKYIIISVV